MVTVVVVAVGMVLDWRGALAQEPESMTWLDVQRVDVSPPLLRSGGTVTVEAVVVNRGQIAVTGLRLGLAVSVSQTGGKQWRILETNPRSPIPSLAPNETIEFSGRIQIEGDGWFRVGVHGGAVNANLDPQGRLVRSVEPTVTLAGTVAVFLAFAVLIGLGSAATRAAFQIEVEERLMRPVPIMIAVGAGLTIAGPLAFWSSDDWSGWRAHSGVVVFALGWVTIGAGLRPRRHAWRGALLAAALYGLLGLAWAVAVNVGLQEKPFSSLVRSVVLTDAYSWPFQVAQLINLVHV